LGCYLRELRLNSGLTQQELADQLNLSRRTIVRIEQGNNANLLSIIVMAAELNIDLRNLMSIIDEL